jgi:hypothetical protein
MEEGIQMYKLNNSVHLHKIKLLDALLSIDTFVREHVRRHDKWENRWNKDDLKEATEIKAYITLPAGNSTLIELPFACTEATRWGDLLEEIDSIKEKSRLILAFPARRLNTDPPSRSTSRSTNRTLTVHRPNNKRSKSQLRESSSDKEEVETAVKKEPKIKKELKIKEVKEEIKKEIKEEIEEEAIEANESDELSSLIDLNEGSLLDLERQFTDIEFELDDPFTQPTPLVRTSRRKRKLSERKRESLE